MFTQSTSQYDRKDNTHSLCCMLQRRWLILFWSSNPPCVYACKFWASIYILSLLSQQRHQAKIWIDSLTEKKTKQLDLQYSGTFSPEKISTNVLQQHCAKFSQNLFSHTPKFFPKRISSDALRRWQVTSMLGECSVCGYHVYIDALDASIGKEPDYV